MLPPGMVDETLSSSSTAEHTAGASASHRDASPPPGQREVAIPCGSDTPPSKKLVACDLRPIVHDGAHAHHIHEFGDVDRIVHVAVSESSAAEEEHPVLPISNKARSARMERWRRLRRRCFRERHLMQYFYNDTLYRTVGTRTVTREELFLDLVIVAAVAALGHELRESGITWKSVEKFLLLFSAVYAAWRQIVFFWNLWGVLQDLLEKIGIYISFLALTGIALGSHNAFDDLGRPYVAVSAFIASLLPIAGSAFQASRERLFRNPANRVNQLVLNSAAQLVSVLPYFAAAFVRSEKATRALYWVTASTQLFITLVPFWIYKWLHQNVTRATRLALNIELYVEKFEVLTMIVMGETIIGFLFEAGAALTKEGVRIGLMYASAVAATAILYSLQTLYVQVDGPIQRGGKHAIRHNAYAGLAWSALHIPYHFFLILFATGLSISLRDVAIPPVESAVRTLIRASSEDAQGAAQFTRNARWVFSVGWGGAIICSALLGALHRPGPRAATKLHRIGVRCIIAIAFMVGLPFSNLSAGWFQGVVAFVSVAMSLAEFLFVQMDRIGFFRSEASAGFTSTISATKDSEPGVFGDSLSESSEMDPDFDMESARPPDEVNVSVDVQEGHSSNDEFVVELKDRLCKGHSRRMVPICPKKTEQRSSREESREPGGKG